jgi:hypothetical protein
MRISLALGPRRALSRQTAWGCLTSNLALPGSGSLVAGHPVGYAQLALALGGFVVSAIFGVRFIVWQLANWSRFHSPEADPAADLLEIWLHLRWALLGMAIVFVSFLWALTTSLAILRSASNEDAAHETPPRL